MNPVYRRRYNPVYSPSPFPGSGRAGVRTPVRSLYPVLRPYSLSRRAGFSVFAGAGIAIFWAAPLLMLPLFNLLAKFLYPGWNILPGFYRGRVMLRPPTSPVFFREIAVLLAAAAGVVLIQAGLALALGRRRPWSESITVGPLLALPVYGVLRGFQATAGDSLFFPLPCLGAALLIWLGISATILWSRRRGGE